MARRPGTLARARASAQRDRQQQRAIALRLGRPSVERFPSKLASHYARDASQPADRGVVCDR